MEEKFNIISFLKKAVAMGASDEHLRVGHAPYIRKDGEIWKVNLPPLTEDDLKNALAVIIPAALRESAQGVNDLDFIIVPANALGGIPVLEANKKNIKIFAIEENKSQLDVTSEKIQVKCDIIKTYKELLELLW